MGDSETREMVRISCVLGNAMRQQGCRIISVWREGDALSIWGRWRGIKYLGEMERGDRKAF